MLYIRGTPDRLALWLAGCVFLDADLVSILLPLHREGNISSFTIAPPPSFVDFAGAYYGLRDS